MTELSKNTELQQSCITAVMPSTEKEKLDVIFNYYTQNEVAMILGITQWKLLEKMQKNDFSEVEVMDIEHILKRDIKEGNFYSKQDMIDFYNFIKEECDVKNCSGYADFHFNLFLKKRSLKRKS